MSWASVAASLLSSLYSCSKSRAAADTVRLLCNHHHQVKLTFIAVRGKMQGSAHAKNRLENSARVSILSIQCIEDYWLIAY